MASPKQEKRKEKKEAFTHVHVREEGMISDEITEKQFTHDVDDIEKGLRAIYKGDDADLAVVTKAPGGLTRVLGKVIFSLFVLCIVLAGGLFMWAWWKGNASSKEAVHVSIAAPISVRSGEEVTVEISYENPRSVALAQLALDVNLPKGFHPESFTPAPTNAEQLVWTVGTLGRYSDGKITMTGRWYGDLPEDDHIQVVTTYRPANFNADFSSITTADVAVHESVLTATLTGPEKATAGELVTYTATFTNTGLLPQEGEAEFHIPQGFVPKVWTPALAPGEGTVWSLGTLAPGAVVTQEVQGAYVSEVDDLQEMNVVSFLKSSEGDMYAQGGVSWLTDVQGGLVSVVLAGNGSTTKTSVVPGEQVRISVQLANISASPVADAKILLDFQPESGLPVAWSEANVGKAKITAQGVVLAPADVGTLAPGERKTYSFLFPIKENLPEGGASTFTVTAYVESGGVTVQSAPLSVSLQADVSLSSTARYYGEDGSQLGSGMFPPRVGEQTTFVLFWSFARSLHALNNVTITATLPQNVDFHAIRNTTTGSLAYNEDSRVLTWNIANVPADVEGGTAQVEVVYTPSEGDVDTYGKLLSGSLLRGEDAETGVIVNAQAEEVTTEMPEDSVAAQKGIVQE